MDIKVKGVGIVGQSYHVNAKIPFYYLMQMSLKTVLIYE